MPTVIRAERPLDHDEIRRVNDLAFGQAAEGRLVDALRLGSTFVPPLSLVALVGQEIVGHILFTRITVAASSQRHDVLALAPMAVVPAHQRSGIGSMLVQRGLADARELGHRVVVVVGHPEFYPRFGFTPARREGILPPFGLPDEAFMVLELQPGALAGITGTVEYPPAFADV